jgi:2-keto-4-pentenoate hydratase
MPADPAAVPAAEQEQHGIARAADTLAAAGDPLRAGDVVLTGALGPMVPARPGDVFEAVISDLGTVRVSFAEAAEEK